MKKMFLVLITVILLICFIGCNKNKYKDVIITKSQEYRMYSGEAKLIKYGDSITCSYITQIKNNWIDYIPVDNLKYINEGQVIELGLDPSHYLTDDLEIKYKMYHYNFYIYTPEIIDIYEDGTVVISYQDEGISYKYISVTKLYMERVKSYFDQKKFANVIIEIDKENVEKISVYPFNNSINVVTNIDKINSLIEQFYGVVCDKCDNIDVSKKEYEIEVVTKDGEIYDIILNSDGSVGYYFNNEYYLSMPHTISILYFASTLKEGSTCSYVRSSNYFSGIGISDNVWEIGPYMCAPLPELFSEYIAASEKDGEVILEIYYNVDNRVYYDGIIRFYIERSSDDGEKIQEEVCEVELGILVGSVYSYPMINGRIILNGLTQVKIDIGDCISHNSSLKEGRLYYELSFGGKKERQFINYIQSNDKLELSINE